MKNSVFCAITQLPSSRGFHVSSLEMEATCPSEPSVDIQRTTRPYAPEKRTLMSEMSITALGFNQISDSPLACC
jgi:hypothetical protein